MVPQVHRPGSIDDPNRRGAKSYMQSAVAGNSALTAAMTVPADAGQPGSLKTMPPVRDWTIIDATIDNTLAIAEQNGDESTAEQGHVICEAGWAASRRHPKAEQGWGGWPPHEASP